MLAISWNRAAQSFYVVQMGRDQLNVVAPEYYDELDNAERVAEVMHKLEEGANFGWPYTYWDPIKKARMLAPEHGGESQSGCAASSRKIDLSQWAPVDLGAGLYRLLGCRVE